MLALFVLLRALWALARLELLQVPRWRRMLVLTLWALLVLLRTLLLLLLQALRTPRAHLLVPPWAQRALLLVLPRAQLVRRRMGPLLVLDALRAQRPCAPPLPIRAL